MLPRCASPLLAVVLASACGAPSPPPPASAHIAPGAGVKPAVEHADADAKAHADADAHAGANADADAHADADANAKAHAGANAFTLRLYSSLAKKKGNLFVSGVGLRDALGVVYLGALGETAREMNAALALPGDASKTAAFAKEEAKDFRAAAGKAELVAASRLWVDKGTKPDERYAAMVSDAYGAAPASVDFASAPEDARRTINGWVSENTRGKIADLLPAGAVDRQSRVVVTNAIYFKGRWPLPFSTTATKEEAFESEAGRSKKVPTMHATESYAYAKTGGIAALELRYEGSDMAMLVVLPDDRSGLAKIEGALDADVYASWTKALARRRVNVSLPKFSFASGGAMTATLHELGMRRAFGPKAELGNIASVAQGETLHVDQVVQKTFVAVDEVGTEAAAASGVVMRTTSLELGPVADFKADHPFLVIVHDAKRGAILFAGRVTDPNAK